MEAADSLIAGLEPEAGAAGVLAEQQYPVEAGDQSRGQIVIKESFCAPWTEDPAAFDPARAGWEQAAGNVLKKIQEMLVAPEVTLTPDGLTPAQAAAKEQAELLAGANARAQELAQSLAGVRAEISQATAEFPPAPLPNEPLPSPDTVIGQLQEAASIPPSVPEVQAEPLLAEQPPAMPPTLEASSPLVQLLEQAPAEMRQEIEHKLSEFGENFDEKKFAEEHPEEYALINQVISESSDPTKAAEAAGKIKAHLDDLDKQEDNDKKKKDFLVNLFSIYKRRLNQETDPKKKDEIRKSMLGLNKELAGLGVGAFGGIIDAIIGAVVGEVQEQLK